MTRMAPLAEQRFHLLQIIDRPGGLFAIRRLPHYRQRRDAPHEPADDRRRQNAGPLLLLFRMLAIAHALDSTGGEMSTPAAIRFPKSRLLAVAERPVRGSRLTFHCHSSIARPRSRRRVGPNGPAALVLCESNRHNRISEVAAHTVRPTGRFTRLNHFYGQRCKMKLVIAGMPMSKWDRRFCKLAKFVSKWSKDPSAKVGAVLYSRRGGDITIGYNGFPIGVEDSANRLKDKKRKLEMVVHAEVNAIVAAGLRAQGATLYVWGKPICARCAGPIIQSGIKRVVALSPTSEKGKWGKSGKVAYKMLTEAGIDIDLYEKKK